MAFDGIGAGVNDDAAWPCPFLWRTGSCQKLSIRARAMWRSGGSCIGHLDYNGLQLSLFGKRKWLFGLVGKLHV